MKKYLELIRVKHWLKNFLIFIPLITAHILNYQNLILVFGGWLAFSFLSSFIYIVNDIRDIEKDKLHPRKKKRPLPSGKIKKQTALIIAVVMLILALGLNVLITKSVFNGAMLCLGLYLILNLLYSFGLKNYAIWDVVILATGFIIRIYYGANLVGVNVSDWLFLTIMNASLFLGLGKRRKEAETSKETRKVLDAYNVSFLSRFQYLCLGLTLVFYSLWTIEQNVKYLLITIPLITIIFMKYCLIIEKSDEGDPITIMYEDKSLIALAAIYGIIMLFLML